MKALVLVVSVVAVLLGGLWLLQGLGLLTIQRILCVANCEPLEGPSTTWALAGVLVVALGLAGLRSVSGERWRRPSQGVRT